PSRHIRPFPTRRSSDLGRPSVMCDRRQIGQVLTNLLQNASDAVAARLEAEPDGPSGWVGVAIEETEGSISLTVEDNGVGLPHALDRKSTRLNSSHVKNS